MTSSNTPLKNDLFLRAARGEPVEKTPVWAMRQAGRYLPEYNATRAKAGSFFALCESPEHVAEVTLQPLARFSLDAAIIFSDILVIPRALGMEVVMVEKKGPSLPTPLRTPEDLDTLLRLPADLPSSLGYVYRGIERTQAALDRSVPLIGFSGAPWTLMCYMVEGSGSKTFSAAKRWLYLHPEPSRRLLRLLSEVVAQHLLLQADAGADALMLFDSWAGELSPSAFAEFVLPELRWIAERIRERYPGGEGRLPLLVFPKGCHYALERIVAETVWDVVGVDWTMDPKETRARVERAAAEAGRCVVLQGNLDPCALYGEPESIRAQTREMLQGFGSQRLIANLGHGMLPDHNPERLKVFVDAVHEYSSSAQ